MNTPYNLRKRIIQTVATILIMLASPLQAQITVDGTAPFMDKGTGHCLLSIDKALWGKEYRAHIATNGCTVTIDGKGVTDGMFTFGDVNAGNRFRIDTQYNDSTATSELAFTFLPILHIEGNFGYEYCDATVTLQNPGEEVSTMKAVIKWRGGSTNVDGKNKRNYKIKFVDAKGGKKEYRFFGLRKDNIWILDAGQVDMSRIRNRAAADLWNAFASKPYYIEEEPDALTASRGELVELFVNGRYQGVFNMCEPIDRKQMKLMKFSSYDGTIHGGLWKSTGWGYATFWDAPGEYDNTMESWNVFELKYPEVDDLCPSDYSTLYNAIEFVSTSTDEEFIAYVGDYFDIPVLIDYYIFCNMLNAFDNCGKNVYWGVYDKVTSRKLTPAMWDLDCTVGQNYTNNPQRPDHVRPDRNLLYPTRIISRLTELDADGFNSRVAERYHSLREGILSTDSLTARYAVLIHRLKESGAAQREKERWSKDSDISGLTLDMDAELAYITEWITARGIYLDRQWKTASGIAEYIEETDKPQRFNIYGQRVDNNYKGIVIINGRKKFQR